MDTLNHHFRRIDQFLSPYLASDLPIARKQVLYEAIIERFHLNLSKPMHCIEIPGLAINGMAFWISESYAYSYRMEEVGGKPTKVFTNIWTKGVPILLESALLGQTDRGEYIEVLEQTEYLYMAYRDVLYLMDAYAEIKQLVQQFISLSNRSSLDFLMISKLPIASRVERFHQEYPRLLQASSMELRAEMLGITRQTYKKYLYKR
jgi:hypothetical protein